MSTSLTENLFSIKNIRKIFRNGSCIEYQGEIFIKKQSFTFITGYSGVGKSSLLHILGLLDNAEPIDSGSILTYSPDHEDATVNYFELFKNKWGIFNRSYDRARIRRSDFSFLPQEGHLLNTFSIQENLELVFNLRHNLCQNPSNPQKEFQKILKSVGFKEDENIWKRRNFSPLNLSGGQRQRLALARAIVCDREPKVIFVDEPTTFMNEELVKLTFNLLVNLVLERQCTIILVTHEYKVLSKYLQENLQNRGESRKIEDSYSLSLDSMNNRTATVKFNH